MKVQIVYPEDGWILQKLAKYLIDNIDFVTGLHTFDEKTDWDVTYFVNYYLYKPSVFTLGRPIKNSKISGAFFTHNQFKRYDKCAKQLDFCVTPCKLYADYLKKINKNTYLIYHGIDFEKFKPKVRLGFIGSIKGDNRKGSDIFEHLEKLPFVELKMTNGKLKDEEIPDFYNAIDYVLIASTMEAGPLCFQEGLASGKEVISTDVGMVHEFKDSKFVHIFDRNNPNTLINLVSDLYKKRVEIRNSIEKYSIDYFVNSHASLFKRLVEERPS